MALCVIEWTDRVHGQEIKVSILPYPFNIRRWSIAAAGLALLAGTACQIGAAPAAEPMPSATPAPMASTSVGSTNADARQPQASGSAAAPASSRPPPPSNETASPGLSASDAPTLPELIPPDKPFALAEGVPEELAVVWEVWSLLADEHVDRAEFDAEEFTEAAIRGLLTALDDPHTNYVRPEAFGIENADIQGRFEGIGAHVSMNTDGRLVVVAPIADSPAEKAGIRPGDIILEVDGESIAGLSLVEAVSKIRGQRDTIVRLLVQHIGEPEQVIIEVKRGVIPLESVLVRTDPGARIAHIRLTNFYENTADKLADAISDAVDGGAAGIVLDVRDNPGGLLSSVIDVTSLFLDDGLILYEVDGDGNRRDWEDRRRDRVAESVPMVMLANQFSASASEILVGALQDHDRATVVGATTFGKGSVNILRQLDNGGGLFLTFARWYTPDGRLIEGNGLAPDIEVTDRDEREADIMQLEKAIETLEAELDRRASARSAA